MKSNISNSLLHDSHWGICCNPWLVKFGGFCMFIRVSSFCVKYGNIHIKSYIEGANWPQFIHGLMK